MKLNRLFILVLLFHITTMIFGQEVKIIIPPDGGRYSVYLRQLEAGNTDIDYTDFRHSFLEGKQFDRKGMEYDSLKKQVYIKIKNKNYNGVIKQTKAMLSIDYTSMFAHKYLQQTYKILGDTLNQKKYHDIEFDLLYSITRSGDGKTCETGWHVTQIEEEYFVLNMIGVELQKQSTSRAGKNSCDKMVVKTEEGKMETYYFEANKIFEVEQNLLRK